MVKMDLIREAYGKPIMVSSGFRCRMHNAEVGGVGNSLHTLGRAMDCMVGDLERLAAIAREHCKEVIVYPTFVHIGDE